MSRTTTVKHLGEAHHYGIAEYKSPHVATLRVTGAATLEVIEGISYATGDTDDIVIIAARAPGDAGYNGTAVTGSTTITVGGQTAVFAKTDPENEMKLISSPTSTTFAVSGGTSGQIFLAFKAPSAVSSTDELFWIEDASPGGGGGATWRNINWRGEYNQTKRIIDREEDNTMNFTVKYQAYTTGLSKYAGRHFTLVSQRYDDDQGSPTETIVTFGCNFSYAGPNETGVDQDSTYSPTINFMAMGFYNGNLFA